MNKKVKHLHVVVDEETYNWLKEGAHKYKRTLGSFVRNIVEVEMMQDVSYRGEKEEWEKDPKEYMKNHTKEEV